MIKSEIDPIIVPKVDLLDLLLLLRGDRVSTIDTKRELTNLIDLLKNDQIDIVEVVNKLRTVKFDVELDTLVDSIIEWYNVRSKLYKRNIHIWQMNSKVRTFVKKHKIQTFNQLSKKNFQVDYMQKFVTSMQDCKTLEGLSKKLKPSFALNYLPYSSNSSNLSIAYKFAMSLRYFPYPKIRDGQLEALLRLQTLGKNDRCLLYMDTGTGKTAIVLNRLISEIIRGKRVLIFVKTISQMESILREVSRLPDNFNIIPKIGQHRLCIDNSSENKHCKVCGKRKKVTKISLLQNQLREVDSEYLSTYINFLRNQDACPYHIQEQLLQYSNLIILPYEFLIPHKFKTLLKKIKLPSDNCIIVIDEVHNLINLKTNQLTRFQLMKLPEAIRQLPLIKMIFTSFEDLKPFKPRGWEVRELLSEMKNLPTRESESIINFFENHDQQTYIPRKNLMINRPIQYSLLFDKKVYFTILMSATLFPLKLYKKIFKPTSFISNGIEHNKNISIYCQYKLNSSHKTRDSGVYSRYIHQIGKSIKLAKKGVLVIFPSYEFMESIFSTLKYSKYQLHFDIIAVRNIDNQMVREKILHADGKIVIATVAGSQFAEGVEYLVNGQSQLDMVILAGLPFLQMNNIGHIMRLLINDGLTLGDARLFVMLVPPYQAIRQGGGRIVRSENDMGKVIILDGRVEKLNKFEFSHKLMKIKYIRTCDQLLRTSPRIHS